MLRRVLVLVVILATAASIIFGQDGKDEIIQKLIARVEALEHEVAALQQTGVVAGNAAPPEPATIAPKQEPAPAVVSSEPEQSEAQLAYRVASDWTPYLRFDYANLYGGGPVAAYAPQFVPWRTVSSGGLRYDMTEAVALKFELGRETDRFRLAWIRAARQVAFTF